MRFFDKDHGPEPQDDDDWGEESLLAFARQAARGYQSEQGQRYGFLVTSARHHKSLA